MGTQSYKNDQILGLTPAVDARKSDKLFALRGRNYIFDSNGPKSAFGNRFLTPFPLGMPAHTQGVRLRLRDGDRSFTMTGDAILEWREDWGGWRVLYPTPDTTVSPYRWSFGYLNDKMFFCHPRTGIIVYDLIQDICYPIGGINGAPTEAIGIAINNGRLIAFDDVFWYWTAQSDGEDFVPRLGGAGFQKISDRVPGYPMAVTSYARGVLTWTTGGVMRSEFTGDASVFRHRSLNTEYRPINSFCTCKVDDDTVIILDERGLYQSKGEAPTPYAPMFNEFLIDYLQRLDLNVGQNVRVEWDDIKKLMYVSTSLSFANPIYESAFVYYPPLDKWGQFNESHYGIVPLKIDDTTRADDYFGFVDVEGRVRYLDAVGSRQIMPSDTTIDLYYPAIQKPPEAPEGTAGTILSSSMVINTINSILYTQWADFYPRDGLTPLPPVLTGLDAMIQLGLLRFEVGEVDINDRMSEITQLMLGNVLSGDELVTGVDYMLIPPGSDEDYLIGLGTEDFGLEEINYVNHQLRVLSSIDGTSDFNITTPELIQFTKGARYFSLSAVGLWHILELSAVSIGEAFHTKALELTVVDAGRLL